MCVIFTAHASISAQSRWSPGRAPMSHMIVRILRVGRAVEAAPERVILDRGQAIPDVGDRGRHLVTEDRPDRSAQRRAHAEAEQPHRATGATSTCSARRSRRTRAGTRHHGSRYPARRRRMRKGRAARSQGPPGPAVRRCAVAGPDARRPRRSSVRAGVSDENFRGHILSVTPIEVVPIGTNVACECTEAAICADWRDPPFGATGPRRTAVARRPQSAIAHDLRGRRREMWQPRLGADLQPWNECATPGMLVP